MFQLIKKQKVLLEIIESKTNTTKSTRLRSSA